MFTFKTYLRVCVSIFLINNVICQEVLVEISQGTLNGSTAVNRDGGNFYSFQTIPYAQPPINELRFKAPVSADGWEGVRDATTSVPTCWQFLGAASYGQEDCLYLNVYTPELPSESATEKPVMVWIHGGGYTIGDGGPTFYSPEFLLTKDIVLVTMNYRLGLFGFLNLDDSELGVPGNAGLKDQVLALQWVKDNIEQFGGDPNDVTIFGESVGGMSVHLHVLSPMSAGLFQKAIAQSGAAISDFLSYDNNNGVLIAQELGIQTEDWSEMLTSLQEVSASEFVIAAQDIEPSPNVEVASNEPAFLSNRPIDIIRSGNYNQVPFLTGATNAEGLYYQQISLDDTAENLLIEDFTAFVPSYFEITSGSEEEAEVAQKIKEFYYGDTEPTREDISEAVALYGHTMFAYPVYWSVLEHLKTQSNPIYFYYFTAETELNFYKQLYPTLSEYPGASHADDLGYLFENIFTPSVIAEDSAEDLGWRIMVNLWTNFAIYGNPTPDDSNGFVWQVVDEDTFNFINIATNITYADINPMADSMQFWYELYEEYMPNFSS